MQALALLIEGIRDPANADSGDAPLLFCEGVITDVSAVADLAAMGGLQIRSWIPLREEGMGGFSWGATPREPFGEASPVTVTILDNDDVLGALFGEDMGDAVTTFYRLTDNQVTRSQTTFRCENLNPLDAAPSVDSYLWLRNEALFISNVTDLGDGAYEIEVDRAQCGSRALAHRVMPKRVEGDAATAALYFSSRPDWDHQYFPCRLYQFTVDAGGAVSSVLSRRFGYIASRPRPTGTGWSLTVEDDTKRMTSHSLGYGAKGVALSRCITVDFTEGAPGIFSTPIMEAHGISMPGLQPVSIRLYMTPQETEAIFGEMVRSLDHDALDETVGGPFDLLVDGLGPNIPLRIGALIECGGWSGLMDFEALRSYSPIGGGAKLCFANFHRVETFEGTIGDLPAATVNDASYDARIEGLNPGWSNLENDPLRPGEEPPKITLWLFAEPGISLVEAFLYLYCSDRGDGANHATYDKLACFGFNGDTSRLNIGSAPATVITTDPGTTELLKLNALMPELFEYRLPTETRWGDWLKNESLRSTCLWMYEPSTGAMGWRQMDRPGPTSPTTIKPLKGQRYKVQPGARLPAVDRIKFEVGFRGKDLKAEDYRIVKLAQTESYDPSTGQTRDSEITIRYWKRVPQFFSSLSSGPLPRLFNFYFRQLRAAPSAFKVPVSVLQGALKLGDFVYWTDATIQTASGRGVTSLVCQVMAGDFDVQHGPEWVLLLPYALSLMQTASGSVAPCFKVVHVETVSAGTVYDVWVRILGEGDATLDINTAYNGLMAAIVDLGGRVRVVSTKRHNPVGQLERKGWLEASCVLTAIAKDGELQRLRLTFDTDWNRSAEIDFRVDLLVRNQSFVMLTDRRRAGANVEGVLIVPPAPMRNEDGDGLLPVADYAPAAPEQPYDGYYYLFT